MRGPHRDDHGGQAQIKTLHGAVADGQTLLEEQEVYLAVHPQQGQGQRPKMGSETGKENNRQRLRRSKRDRSGPDRYKTGD